MRADLFDYELPPSLIAQTPLPRGESRLMVVDRSTGQIRHHQFSELPEFLHTGDGLVLNDTRVTARRLSALRENGAEAEVLLLRPERDRCWIAMVRPGKALKPGRKLTFTVENGCQIEAVVLESYPDGTRLLEFPGTAERDCLAGSGHTPLPPYIHTPLPREEEERYQTVYARYEGSAAAPTAGLHFTNDMLHILREKGIEELHVTLHVGIDTFRPVKELDLETHEMHGETALLDQVTADRLNKLSGRIVAVGTTSVRTLESAARDAGIERAPRADGEGTRLKAFSGETRLFIYPGYQYRAVDALITNFHLPRSTLLMLVSALAGRELILEAYHEAVREKYRFFSFGDAMLIL